MPKSIEWPTAVMKTPFSVTRHSTLQRGRFTTDDGVVKDECQLTTHGGRVSFGHRRPEAAVWGQALEHLVRAAATTATAACSLAQSDERGEVEEGTKKRSALPPRGTPLAEISADKNPSSGMNERSDWRRKPDSGGAGILHRAWNMHSLCHQQKRDGKGHH